MKKENFAIEFLYKTFFGRVILKFITRPVFSKFISKYLNSYFSKWIIGIYIKKYRISLDDYKQRSYPSFNSFFIRRKKKADIDITPNRLISPCDGYLSAYKIDRGLSFTVKRAEYSVGSLLNDKAAAQRYSGGICLVFRLAPYNYHRYIFFDKGFVRKNVSIRGILHCVRPIAYENFPVYLQNSREYSIIKSENFGDFIQMEVGALLVGKIRNYSYIKCVSRGMEKGYFEFGGSTIILIFEKDKAALYDEIIRNSEKGIETPVKLGQKIGYSVIAENRF